MKRCYREKNTRRMLMPTRGNPIRRMSGIFLRLLSSIVCHYVQTIEDNKLRESLHTNRASFAIALGKSVAADLLRFADKSAHKVRSCMSVCFIKCELESRYLHHLRLRMKYSWLLYRLYNIYGGFYSPIDIIEP